MAQSAKSYPATLAIDYPKKLDKVSTFFRVFWSIPIFIILGILMGGETASVNNETATSASVSVRDISSSLFAATALMIVFRQRYPRWWFDFALELNRFSTRVGTYLLLLTDKYPSTEDKQTVHLEIMYPDAQKDLNRWLPLVKWILVFPHYVALLFLFIAAMFVTVVAWFAILFTGSYPKGMFDFMVGVGRWSLRVNAYAFLLVTDEYPPFSLD